MADKVPPVPSSSLALNLLLRHGGLQVGRIVELFGPEEGGKTGISLDLISNAQRLGLKVCFVDAERALDSDYAKMMGATLEEGKPDNELWVPENEMNGAKIFDGVHDRIKKGCQFIVVDSVDALSPPKELEKDSLEDASKLMGLKAQMMAVGIKRLLSIIPNRAVVVFINQIREKIGAYGNPETTPGGRALKFYASYRLRVDREPGPPKETTIQSDVTGAARGHQVRIQLKKSKVGLRGSCHLWLDYFRGIVVRRDHMETAVRLSVIVKKEQKYVFEGFRAKTLPLLADMIFEDKKALAKLRQLCEVKTQDIYSQIMTEPDSY
jgi:recombination protein RecA